MYCYFINIWFSSDQASFPEDTSQYKCQNTQHTYLFSMCFECYQHVLLWELQKVFQTKQNIKCKKIRIHNVSCQLFVLCDVPFFSRILCKHRFYDCHAGILNTFLIRHSKEHPRAVSQQRDEFKGGKKTTMRKTYNYQQCVNGSNEPIWKKQSKKLQKHHICIQHQRKHKLMKPSLLWLPPSSCIPSKLVNEPPSIYSF